MFSRNFWKFDFNVMRIVFFVWLSVIALAQFLKFFKIVNFVRLVLTKFLKFEVDGQLSVLCAFALLLVVYSVSEKGEITFTRVVWPDFSESVGNLLSRDNVFLTAGSQSQCGRLIVNVYVQRQDQIPLV